MSREMTIMDYELKVKQILGDDRRTSALRRWLFTRLMEKIRKEHSYLLPEIEKWEKENNLCRK